MLGVMQFLMRFVLSYGDSFQYFEPHDVEILRLPLAQRNFLLDVGLPKTAEPGLFFHDVREISGTPFAKIGADWQKNLICVDTCKDGLVVLLDRKDVSNVRWFNKSTLVMCEVLYHYMNFLMKAGKEAVLGNEIPDSLIDHFLGRVRCLDPVSVERDSAFWSSHIVWLKSHQRPHGFNPWPWAT